MRIRFRITLPFVALFVISYGALAAVSVFFVSKATETQIAVRVRDLGGPLKRGSLDPRTLSTIKKYQGAVEIFVSISGAPDPKLSTLPEADVRALRPEDLKFDYASWTFLKLGAEYLAVRIRVDDNKDVFILYPAKAVQEEKDKVTGPLLAMAGAGLIGVVVIGFIIAWSIARPIEEVARKAGLGESLQVRGGSREVAQLVQALNRMLARLEESQKSVREAEKAQVVRELAAGVAHEIKNPLQALKMIIELEDKISPQDQKLLLNEIQRIDLASLELLSIAGPTRLQKEPVRLDSLVDDTLELLRRQLDHVKVQVRRTYEASPEVQVDRDRIKRAIMNLVLNGAQAMPQGGMLEVRVQKSNGVARFSVTDEGRGVPEEIRSRIFEPFVTSKQDGVGLGLFVTKKMVEEHQGRVGFESQPGRTTFWIELPNG